jgi:hypothetical protein
MAESNRLLVAWPAMPCLADGRQAAQSRIDPHAMIFRCPRCGPSGDLQHHAGG